MKLGFKQRQIKRIARYERKQKALHKEYKFKKVLMRLALKAIFLKFQKNAKANLERFKSPPKTPIGS